MGLREPGTDPPSSPAKSTVDHAYRLCALDEVPSAGVLRVSLGAGEALTVFRLDDRYFVVDDRCPHRGASLAKYGELAAGTVECILHGAVFDLGTGDCIAGPCAIGLNVHPCTERDGAIYIAR